MKNKYYVPEISEFHVGFEYEIAINYYEDGVKFPTEHPNCWTDDKLEETYDLDMIRLQIESKNIRVKYLDREDIESLGWKDCDDIYNTIRWDYEDYTLMYYKKDDRYLIFRHCGENNLQTVFNGFIKNKSELKKLMQQLNIK